MPWPEYDESKTVAAHVEMAVQVNGKLKGTDHRGRWTASRTTVVEAATSGREGRPARIDGDDRSSRPSFVKNKLVNLIVGKAKIV